MFNYSLIFVCGIVLGGLIGYQYKDNNTYFPVENLIFCYENEKSGSAICHFEKEVWNWL